MTTSSLGISSGLASVLVFLSALHFYWALGGKWGKVGTIPENRGKPLFRPSLASTIMVALGLLGAASVALARGGALGGAGGLPGERAAAGILGLLFVTRSLGEGRYVGFFKRVRGTAFAFWDNWLFSPLALTIGLAFLFLSLR